MTNQTSLPRPAYIIYERVSKRLVAIYWQPLTEEEAEGIAKRLQANPALAMLEHYGNLIVDDNGAERVATGMHMLKKQGFSLAMLARYARDILQPELPITIRHMKVAVAACACGRHNGAEALFAFFPGLGPKEPVGEFLKKFYEEVARLDLRALLGDPDQLPVALKGVLARLGAVVVGMEWTEAAIVCPTGNLN